MKNILIPVDFTSATQNVLSYMAEFCKVVDVESITLVKAFHVPAIAKVLPDANLVEVSENRFIEMQQDFRIRLSNLADQLKAMLPASTGIEQFLIDDKWLPAIQQMIARKKPELVVLANDPSGTNNESSTAEHIIPFAKESTVSLLIVPSCAVFRKLKKVLIPTSFENLDRLRLMQQLCISQSWLEAELIVLNVDPDGRFLMVRDEHPSILDQYLRNYRYEIVYSVVKDVVQDILDHAERYDVEIIMALPGKHNFLYGLMHQSITATFALNAHRPVLLLK